MNTNEAEGQAAHRPKPYSPWPEIDETPKPRRWWASALLDVGNWLVVIQAGMVTVWSLGGTSQSWWWCFLPSYALFALVLAHKDLGVEDFIAPDPPNEGEKAAGALLLVAQLVLVGLKLSGVIEWSWWIVMTPMLVAATPVALLLAHLVLKFIVGFYKAVFSFMRL